MNQHDDQRLVDGRLGTGRYPEFGEQPEPIPTTTASTSTLIAEDTTFAQHLLGRKLSLFQRGKRHQHKPASVVSLNSINVTKVHRQHEEADDDHQPSEK